MVDEKRPGEKWYAREYAASIPRVLPQATVEMEASVSTNLEILEAEVLKLAPVERSHLLERLIASLDIDPEIVDAWAREADLRDTELESGLVAAVPGQQAIARLRTKLAR